MTSQEQATDLQQQNKLLNRLLEVGLILNSNLGIDPLLRYIMDVTCEITNSEASSLLLYDHKTDELHIVASDTAGNNAQELAKVPIPMEGSIAGEIVRKNQSIVIQDGDEDPRIFRGVDEAVNFRTRGLLGVPMSIKGSVIGVLEAVNKSEGKWTDDDLSHLSILASQAAVAIQNAQQSAALTKAYNDLSQLDKLKNDFIAVASHELRTPLGVILGYASFLKEEAEGEASDHAAAVLNSALHLRNLIEDLTNLRYLQLGRSELVCEDVEISDLLEAASHDVQSMASAKGQSLVVDATGGDTVVNVDRLKIGMALTNILNNAIKFTEKGGEIRIGIEKRPHEAWIAISDTGMGIAPDMLEKIFDQFFQVEDHMTRRHNGMGIGLSIAKGMVQAHDGRIWAESDGINKGSTFFVALPLSEN